MAKKLKLRGKELRRLGYPEGKVIGLAVNAILNNHRKEGKAWALAMLTNVLENPDQFYDDQVFGPVARELTGEKERVIEAEHYRLSDKAGEFPIYGEEQIEEGAKHQMYVAMRLPITVAGALMPDAHQGYGLPIGGVLATENSVIPYGVGVDIGCRMCLSVYNLSPNLLIGDKDRFKKLLLDHTRFGQGRHRYPMDDPIFSRREFKYIKVVRDLKDKAFKQIGSSGGGNHFVEFGIANLTDPNNEFDLPIGEYLAVLSHSGSRGLGANIARHYTKLAMQKGKLPKEARHLAWLMLDSEEGQEYWAAMNLAGDYASACHDHIHRRLAKALGENALFRVENHHNFAWRQRLENGKEVVVHRKGATPAAKGELGIIPGSMTAPGYIVRGKGEATSLSSASHGAGRQLSRTQAKKTLSQKLMNNYLAEHGISLIGGGLDEAPMAYKDIHQVMAHQRGLVEVVGTFQPKVVRMEG